MKRAYDAASKDPPELGKDLHGVRAAKGERSHKPNLGETHLAP
jgi:hypothetical protein